MTVSQTLLSQTSFGRIVGLAFVLLLCGTGTAQAQTLTPSPPAPLSTTIKVEYVGTMPSIIAPMSPQQDGPNIGSPVVVKQQIYFVDQHGAILRSNRNGNNIKQIFDAATDAPDGLALDNRQSVLNISPGRTNDTLFVWFQAGSEPTTGIPIYRLPAALPDVCCEPGPGIPVEDLYRLDPLPTEFLQAISFPGRTEYQTLYEYKVQGNKLANPRPIVAFEAQAGPTHNGGGMLTLPDGRVLLATGDQLPFGADGRDAAQDNSSHVSKLIIVNPDDGSIEIAAKGVRNVQHLQYIWDGAGIAFADIGGVTAEEINIVSTSDLQDTTWMENFGWGRNEDGFAREGTFYVGPGRPMIFGTEPPALGDAPQPEPGFIQPHAQYGRNDPTEFVAVTGPVVSPVSFNTLQAVWADLNAGTIYASIDDLTQGNVPIYNPLLVDGNGNPLIDLNALNGGNRVDARFFVYPDGTAGVLLEATGDFYRLTELN